MKKLLLTLLLPLSIISSASYGEEINSLFGITLYDNAEKHVSRNYIDSNKVKNTETLDGYFNLIVTNKIKTKSPYATKYWLTIDNDNKVHLIYGDDDGVVNLDICLQVNKDLVSRLEETNQIDFKYWENSYPAFKQYAHYYRNSLDSAFAIQCKEIFEDSAALRQIYLKTSILLEANEEFYDSGL